MVLELSPDTIAENGEETEVKATLTGGTVGVATVVTVTATAVAPTLAADFELTGNTLTIAPGAEESTGIVTLTAVNNNVDAPDARVQVTGTVPSGSRVTAPDGVELTITDNDRRGVTVSETALSMREGENRTYTVVLESEPTADVTVRIGVGPADANVEVEPPSLTFTAADWATAKPVTVTGLQDDDEEDEEATLTHTVSGGDYGADSSLTSRMPTVGVTVEDDEAESTAVTLTVSPEAVDENEDEPVTVRVTGTLNKKPLEADIDVTLTVTGGTDDGMATEDEDFTVAAVTTLTIKAGEYSGPATFTLTLIDDLIDEPDETVTVSGSTDLTALPDGVTGTELTITDDDPPEIKGPDRPTYVEGNEEPVATYTATNPENGYDHHLVGVGRRRRRQVLISTSPTACCISWTPPDYEDEPPQDADGDGVYEVTVSASDGTLTSEAFFVRVEVMDAPGKLCLSASASSCRPLTAPQVGQEVHAILEDPDGMPRRTSPSRGSGSGSPIRRPRTRTGRRSTTPPPATRPTTRMWTTTCASP